MWWHHDAGWEGWLAMALGMSGFWVLTAVLVVAVLRSLGPLRQHSVEDPRDILAQRLARGDIDPEEYQARLAALSGRKQ